MPGMSAAYQKEYRRRRRANGGLPLRKGPGDLCKKPTPKKKWPEDIGEALRQWSSSLTTPHGHDLQGFPMTLPDYLVDFAREAFQPHIKEAGLFLARKQSKTGGCAIFALSHLVPGAPLAKKGMRLATVSLDRGKAGELLKAARDIALASGLDLEFPKTPAPGRIVSDCGELSVLSGDRNSGASGSYDCILADEVGLFTEKDRPLLESLLGALGSKNGRLICLSILGNGLFTKPMLRRFEAGEKSIHVTAYLPDPSLPIDDPATWRLGNPGLGTPSVAGIKSYEHMESMAARAKADLDYQETFRREELNMPSSGYGTQMIVSLDAFEICVAMGQADRFGPCFLGLDTGGSASMCAVAAYWPTTGRLDVLGCWPNEPTMKERGVADGVGRGYQAMHDAGEILLFGHRWADARAFMGHVLTSWLPGEDIRALIADRYRKEEVTESLHSHNVTFPIEWRGMGAGIDGHTDVKSFRKAVATQTLRPGNKLLLRHAISEAVCNVDSNGNASLDRGRRRGRIDALSAAVLAVGAGMRSELVRQPAPFNFTPLDQLG